LAATGLLVLAGADGLRGRSNVYENVVRAVHDSVARAAFAEGANCCRFASVMPRWSLEQTDYLPSCPDMFGSVTTFMGAIVNT
jgi:hypothetical protein